MKRKIIDWEYKFITKYQKCDELQTKKLKYGLEVIYNLLSKTIILFLISILLGVWKEYILLIIIYSFTRMYTFGIHAKSTLICWFTSTIIYIFGSLFVHYMILSQSIIYLVWTFSFISFVLWAPADTPAKPLLNDKKRKVQKIKSCCVCLIFLLFILYVPNIHITNAICYCLLIQSICINPITYWITKTPYDNYKIYLKKHGLN